MVDGAHRPLLLILREVWPREQQDIREGSTHQHLSLEETAPPKGIHYEKFKSKRQQSSLASYSLWHPLHTLSSGPQAFLKPGPGALV